VLNSNEAFFWANALVDSSATPGEEPAFSVQLRTLSATTDTVTTVPGATVTCKVTTGEGRILYSTQVVDGGSGGGGQGADRLVFGLADASTAELTVLWPDGQEQVIDDVASETDFPHLMLTDEWNPGILTNTISGGYTAGAGTVTWNFSWKTQKPCDGAEVEVTTSAPPGPCRDPLDDGTSVDLSSDDVDVTWTQTASGSNWQQTLSWTTSCSARCNYDFTVKSVVARSTYSGPARILKISTCPVPVP
jgi:hypothetical protein